MNNENKSPRIKYLFNDLDGMALVSKLNIAERFVSRRNIPELNSSLKKNKKKKEKYTTYDETVNAESSRFVAELEIWVGEMKLSDVERDLCVGYLESRINDFLLPVDYWNDSSTLMVKIGAFVTGSAISYVFLEKWVYAIFVSLFFIYVLVFSFIKTKMKQHANYSRVILDLAKPVLLKACRCKDEGAP
jgi:hypothetical protein